MYVPETWGHISGLLAGQCTWLVYLSIALEGLIKLFLPNLFKIKFVISRTTFIINIFHTLSNSTLRKESRSKVTRKDADTIISTDLCGPRFCNMTSFNSNISEILLQRNNYFMKNTTLSSLTTLIPHTMKIFKPN